MDILKSYHFDIRVTNAQLHQGTKQLCADLNHVREMEQMLNRSEKPLRDRRLFLERLLNGIRNELEAIKEGSK